MRVLPSKKARKKMFNQLIKKQKVKNLKELSEKLKIPYKTLNNWRYNYKKYVPYDLIKNNSLELEIEDSKPDNWGQVKGGRKDSEKKRKHLQKLWKDPKYYEQRKKIGKNAIKRLKAIHGDNLIKMIVKGKIKKRERISKQLEEENEHHFTNKIVQLKKINIQLSWKDKEKNIRFPRKMSPELAEEIGVHLGDGCLSYNRNYFSVKCNKKEEKYVTDFLFPLYKKLYNLDLKLMQLPSVSGFEIYSKALCQFKNKVLNIPYGEKKERIEVPKEIIESKNKPIYQSLIRGTFDTDGCVYIAKKKYPIILIDIKSKKLIEQISNMLKKLGFIPAIYKYHRIAISGPTMLNKWIKEINSNNPKNITKLKQAQASSSVWIRT